MSVKQRAAICIWNRAGGRVLDQSLKALLWKALEPLSEEECSTIINQMGSIQDRTALSKLNSHPKVYDVALKIFSAYRVAYPHYAGGVIPQLDPITQAEIEEVLEDETAWGFTRGKKLAPVQAPAHRLPASGQEVSALEKEVSALMQTPAAFGAGATTLEQEMSALKRRMSSSVQTQAAPVPS